MSLSHPVRVAVVIVSYNTNALLRQCLHSVRATQETAPEIDLHTLVIDNASHDGSAQMVANEFPDVSLYPLSQNTGFTGGNNLALSLLGFPAQTPEDTSQMGHTATALKTKQRVPDSPPDFVLLLNSDAQLVDHALTSMLHVMQRYADAAVCGPRLQYAGGRFQHGAFQFPGLAQILLDLFPLPWLPGWHRLEASRLNGRYPARLWDGDAPFRVDFVLGAAFLMRGQAIRQLGGLDAGFFMYCEEMDWCLRSRCAGWQTYAVPSATVIHYAGQSSRQTRWTSYARLWRSRLRFYRKYRQEFSSLRAALVSVTIGVGMSVWATITRHAFRMGRISGVEAGERLAAYRAIRRDCMWPPSNGASNIDPAVSIRTPQTSIDP